MPLHVKCPHCDALLPNAEDLLSPDGLGFVVCPECRGQFRVKLPPRPVPHPATEVDLPSLSEPDEIPLLDVVTEEVPALVADAPPPASKRPAPAKTPPAPRRGGSSASAPKPSGRGTAASAPPRRPSGSAAPPAKTPTSVGRYAFLGAFAALLVVMAVLLFMVLFRGKPEPVAEDELPPEPVAKLRDPALKVGPQQEPLKEAFPIPGPIPGGLSPTRMTRPREERQVSGRVHDCVVGGGGRYLILNLQSERKVAIFDTVKAEVVRYLPLPSSSSIVAAGVRSFLVIDPDEQAIVRYALGTFEQEGGHRLSVNGRIHTALLGSASNGPLVLGYGGSRGAGGGGVMLLDPETFKEFAVEQRHLFFWDGFSPNVVTRISADGRVITRYQSEPDKARGQAYLLRENKVETYQLDPSHVGHVWPTARGTYLCGSGGVLGLREAASARAADTPRSYAIPAAEGETFYLNVDLSGSDDDPSRSAAVSVRLLDRREPLVSIPGIELPSGMKVTQRGRTGFDRRFIFLPTVRLLVVIPDSPGRLQLHRVDVAEELKARGKDYLFFDSNPPTHAGRGKSLEYPVRVSSSRPPVQLSVAHGPPGMTFSGDRLNWTVPSDFKDADVDVVLTADNGGPRPASQRFKLSVVDRLPEPPPEPPPEVPPGEARAVVEISTATARAPDRADGIRRAPLKEDREVRELPGPVGNSCVGGAGRYLFFEIPSIRRVAVFDVNQAEVVKWLEVPFENEPYLMAAGRNDLVLVGVTGPRMYRYSLKTFQQAAVDLPADPARPRHYECALMGSAADGPLLLYVGGSGHDREPFHVIDLNDRNRRYGTPPAGEFDGVRGHHLDITPDGRRLVVARRQTSKIYRLAGDRLEPIDSARPGTSFSEAPQGYLAPGGDGRLIFGPDRWYDRDGKLLAKQNGSSPAEYCYVPAVEGSFFLSLSIPHSAGGPRPPSRIRPALHLPERAEPFSRLPELAGTESLGARVASTLPMNRHVLWVPSADLLVLAPPASDRQQLHLYRVDLAKLLADSDTDFLFVGGPSVLEVPKGKRWEHRVAVYSKRPTVKARLGIAPEGMTLAPDGKLYWDVPANFPSPTAEVVLYLGDGRRDEVMHRYELRVDR